MWTKCPVCTKGRATETRYRIQETNWWIFYWIQNGEEEEREEDSPCLFFCEDCEEDLDNWDNRRPTEAVTKQKPSCTTCIDGQEKEDRCQIERTRQRLYWGPWIPSEEPDRYVKFVYETCRVQRNGEKEEPEPKRPRIAQFENSVVEESNPSPSFSGTIPPNMEKWNTTLFFFSNEITFFLRLIAYWCSLIDV
jgi:hypothetical protein